ncbi:MAG: hypothetical protein P9M08_06385 [Candidatus Erginobacter occultus]|nr:hypothetical protein [Candidatus Erginobacter occultus]
MRPMFTGKTDIRKTVGLAAGAALLFLLPAAPASAERLLPSDLEYRGAFRLPGPGGEAGWAWGGNALAYYPEGNPGGPADGCLGSLFGTGHNWYQYVSEISIPQPVISPGKKLSDLNTASTIQPFADIRGGLYPEFEIPYCGLEYLPAGNGRSAERLYFGWHQHLQVDPHSPTHGWCSLNLSAPNPAGPWQIGNYDTYSTTDYLFSIPQSWANAYTGGRSLATGRMRDGGQGGQGPCIYAFAAWQEGNPPAANAVLGATPLLQYSTSYYEDPHGGAYTMDRYHHSDEWPGAAWLSAGGKEAVIFAGTKGRGECWYGNPDGPCLECDNRGWWSTYFDGEIIFYDPADLAAVARGELAPYQPQPYAVMNIDHLLYQVTGEQQKTHLAAAAVDRVNGFLYVFEPLVDDDKPIVHVWKVTGGGSGEVVPRPGDYNGDGTGDLAVFRPTDGLWAIRGLTRAYFGAVGDLPVPADYRGDGTDEIAIFRNVSGLWSARGGPRVYFGKAGDLPDPRDYNGDGTVDIAVFRPATGLWAIRGVSRCYFGTDGDSPVAADYSGDGTSNPAVFRPASGLWAVRGFTRAYFGAADDIPVPGDYTGDGSCSPAVFRPTSGLWAVREGGRAYFGTSGDIPVPGDYEGSGTDQAAVFRPASGLWAIRGITRAYFGGSGDIPIGR